MTSGPWDIAQAAAQRSGLDGLTVYAHTVAHHDGNPLLPGWADQCEAAAVCLLDADRTRRAVRKVTS